MKITFSWNLHGQNYNLIFSRAYNNNNNQLYTSDKYMNMMKKYGKQEKKQNQNTMGLSPEICKFHLEHAM